MEDAITNNPAAKEPAKDTFLHLLSAAMLYLSVIGFITLWWQIINFLVPDKLNPQGYGSQIYTTLIWGTSASVVAFPVLILISWIIGRDLRANPAKREAGVRKWLWYITLFVSALTIIIDLVVLIYNFLRGDLTAQFFLKLAVILISAAVVFGYYLWDLRKRAKDSTCRKESPGSLPRSSPPASVTGSFWWGRRQNSATSGLTSKGQAICSRSKIRRQITGSKKMHCQPTWQSWPRSVIPCPRIRKPGSNTNTPSPAAFRSGFARISRRFPIPPPEQAILIIRRRV